MHLGEWRHLDRIVDDEGWLYERAFASLAKDLVDEFALAHSVIYLNSTFLCHLTHLVLAHLRQVVTGLFLDGIEDWESAIWSLEVHDIVAYLDFCCAVDCNADLLDQLLGERHHPVVILI